MKKWKIVIYQGEKVVRSIPLSHEYDTDEEAMREATHVADEECRGDDEDWTLEEGVDIQCGNCGATTSVELFKCTSCGKRLYSYPIPKKYKKLVS